MRQSLQIRLGQQLTMTPQLQQAIRLLQLSSLDLQTEIQQVLDSNLMLERTDDPIEQLASASDTPSTTEASEAPAEQPAAETSAESNTAEEPIESGWDDVDDFYDGSTSYSRDDDDQRDSFEQRTAEGESLHDYLLWQMRLTPFSEVDLEVAMAIIDAVDDSGYLSLSLEDIHQGLNKDGELEFNEVEAVLHRIQRFDPPGVAARTLSECLLLQMEQLPADTCHLEKARELVACHLEMLAGREFNTLMRRLKVTREELQDIIVFIQSLNPRPGTQIASGEAQYIVPDVFVYRSKNTWRVDLNPESTPKLRINNQYARMVRRADSSADNMYLKNHLQEARWFLKSLRNRNETLLKVATSIIERQRDFFEHGEEHMRPLVLRDIAESMGMHESTISRVTTQKYMHTPRGIYEFKYFFSSHVGTSDGGECSSVAIRAMIKKLIDAENPLKPLSDHKIAECLSAEGGIKVARRTVAKYREVMSIPSSTDRKRLA